MTTRPSILVTGGAGYIGSHCCSLLRKSGYHPVSYDNLSTGHQSFVRWGPLVVGDVRDTAAVKEALKEHEISAVVHFAAVSSVSESMADPGKYYSNNVAGTLALLNAMQAYGCAKLVLSSSGAVYGEAGTALIGEHTICEPVNPYGRTKLVVEGMVRDYARLSTLCAISLRYFNASGAEDSGLIGELRDPETHLIPRALMNLQGYLPELAIFGEDYNTPDGTAVRDYIHVVDLAEAHRLALGAVGNGVRCGVFNLGTGTGYSVREIVNAVESITGRKLGLVQKPRRMGDPAALIADPSSSKLVLGFSPKCSDLKTIISSAWRWHQKAHPTCNVEGASKIAV